MNAHVVILVPGLGKLNKSRLIRNIWKMNGVEVVFFESNWETDENYQIKLDRLLNLVDRNLKNKKVSLIGTSAGGSLVMNVFNERKNKINKVVTVCSRLKKGEEIGFRGFIKRTKKSLSFRESVLNSERNIDIFSFEDKKKIMTVSALFGDELVPKNTSIVSGVKNITIPTSEHLFSIWSSFTWYSKLLIKFLIN